MVFCSIFLGSQVIISDQIVASKTEEMKGVFLLRLRI